MTAFFPTRSGSDEMRSKFFRTVLLCVIAGVFWSGANAQKFEVVDATTILTLTADKAATVTILNNTTTPITVSVSIVDRDKEGGPGLSSITEIEPNTVTLTAAGAATVKIKVKSPEATPLSGYLVVVNQASNSVVRRKVEFKPVAEQSADSIPKLQSLSTSVTSTAYYFPWQSKQARPLDVALPLNAVIKPAVLDKIFKDKPVGHLVSDSGNSAALQYQGAKENLPAGTTGVLVAFKSDGRPGTYKGPLMITKAGEDKPLELTVISKHHWILPALVIAAAILLYYLMQWYLNVVRKIWGLQTRVALAQDGFSRADEAFAQDAAGKPFTRYSICVDFDRQAEALLSKLRSLKYTNYVRLEENSDAYKSVSTALADLESQASIWKSFAASKLTPLQDALKMVNASFVAPPNELGLENQKTPAVAAEATRLLNGEPEITIDAFKKLSTSIDTLLPRLRPWVTLNQRAEKVWREFGEIITSLPTENSKAELKIYQKSAFTKWRSLWTRADFDPAGVEMELHLLETELVQAKSAALELLALPTTFSAFPEELPATSSSPLERAEQIALKRRSLDFLYLLLVVSIALYSGLVSNYFNVPFGTFRDYLSIFIVGFGTKPVIDLIAAGVGRLMPAKAF